MVTMPSEAASDYLLVRELVAAGMDCMRINCAHDGVAEWERMIENLRRARRELGKKCRVLMDIGGPKLRTGPVDEGTPATFDRKGKVVKPAAIGCTLPEVFSDVRAGDRIWFDDGKIAGIVRGATFDWLKVEIDRVGKNCGERKGSICLTVN